MGPRQTVTAALAGLDLPIVQGRWPTNIAQPTLVVTTGTIEPHPVGTVRRWTVTVTVLSPLAGEHADDDLETTLSDVLAALDTAQPLAFTGGRRVAVFDDAYNAYEIDMTVLTNITPQESP